MCVCGGGGVFAYLLGHSALEICYGSLGFRELCFHIFFCWYNKEEGVCVCVCVCVIVLRHPGLPQ